MARAGKFGTFSGVFSPSILTILGVIMYLRLPMIVGEGGLFVALGIILVAHVISISTGLSVSSIATDKKVQAGGTYYMVSRSLGLPMGGTLGLALFVGLSFSVSLYLIGFSESFLSYWGFEVTRQSIRLTGSIVLGVVTVVTLISTTLAIRTQYLIMTAIVLSLISVFFGSIQEIPGEPWLSNPASTIPVMVLFGIFFPAVTGFEAGVSMSGDLANPKKSIPVGAIAAIGVGFLVYVSLAVFLALTVDGTALAGDPQVLLKIALVPELVVAGIWGATLSSALGSILGAPRILQATAADKITPSFFAHGSGGTNEPRRALMLSFLIAEGGILIGELDIIARIVSIFFITTYGFLNLSCAFESWTSADFRPEFRSPIWVSLVGAVACLLVMIQLDILAMIAGTILLGGAFLLLKRKELRLESGDAWSGVWASLVKAGIERLKGEEVHTRNWRPNIILFRGTEEQREHLHEMGEAIAGKLGILSSFELVVREEEQRRRLESLRADDEAHIHSFRHYCRNLYDGMEEVIRLYGFSSIRPNTVLMGWSKQEKLRPEFMDVIRTGIRTDMNLAFLHFHPERKFGDATTIDVWWNGRGSTLALAITLLRHLTSSPIWREARMRLLVINNDSSRSERVYQSLRKILEEYRIGMEIRVLDNEREKLSEEEWIERESSATDLTLIRLRGITESNLDTSVERIHRLSGRLGSTLILHGSSQFEELDAGVVAEREPEPEGMPAETSALPLLPAARSVRVGADLRQADETEQTEARRVFDRVFGPWYAEEQSVVGSISEMVDSLEEALERATRFTDGFRQRRALLKAQNDYLFRCRELLRSVSSESLPAQQAAMAEHMVESIERRTGVPGRFPRSITLEYPRQELRVQKGERLGLILRKRWKRLVHSVLGFPARARVPYRAVAEQYLVHRQHAFLAEAGTQFVQASAAFLSSLRAELLTMAASLRDLEQRIPEHKLTSQDVGALFEQFRSAMEELRTASQHRHERLLGQMLRDARESIIAMQAELDRFGAGRRGRPHATKTSPKNLRTCRGLADLWLSEATLAVEKAVLDVAMASLRGRVHDRVEELMLTVAQSIDASIISPLERFREDLKEDLRNPERRPGAFGLERRFDFADELAEAHEDMLEVARGLPESLTVRRSDEGPPGGAETVKVAPARLAQYSIDSELIGRLQEQLSLSAQKLAEIEEEVRDHVNLARFGIENLDPDVEDHSSQAASIVSGALRQLEEQQNHVEQVRDDIDTEARAALTSAFAPLEPGRVVQSAEEFGGALREYAGRKVLTVAGEGLKQAWKFVEGWVIDLVYSRSEGVLLARRMAHPPVTPTSRILSLVEELTPGERVLNELPHFYINLFSGKSSISREFWVPRADAEAAFARAHERHKRGHHGSIVVLSERNGGKTAFCRQMGATLFARESVFHVFPPREGSVDPELFARVLKRATGFGGAPPDILRALPRNSVLFLHDIELWFERSPNGLAVISQIRACIEQQGRSVLVVLNTNPSAFSLLRKLEPLGELAIEEITLPPMSARGLRDMILLRHRSSSMQFRLGRKVEEKLSALSLARLFDTYFQISGGNPGVALIIWLANITHVRDKEILIRMPEPPSPGALATLDEDWLLFLTQFVIHKRLSSERLERMTSLNGEPLRRTIARMGAVGLLLERSPGLYTINPYLDGLVQKTLRGRGLL